LARKALASNLLRSTVSQALLEELKLMADR
jgi:hypothetical protein